MNSEINNWIGEKEINIDLLTNCVYNRDLFENVELDVIDYILNHKNLKNLNFYKVYRLFVRLGYLELVKRYSDKFIKQGHAIDSKILDLAVYSGNIDIVKHLLDQGIKLSKYSLQKCLKTGDIQLIELLVVNGSKLTNYTMMEAIRYKRIDLIDFVMFNGKISVTDEFIDFAKKLKEPDTNIINYLQRFKRS